MSDTAVATPPVAPQGWQLSKNGKKIRPVELPAPLVHVRWNKPGTWVRKLVNFVQGLILVLIAGYLGMLMAAAVYYLVTQTTDTMNNAWHSLVPTDYWRHIFRDSFEGFTGGLFGMFVGWNGLKPRKAEPNWIDSIMKDKLKLATMYDEDPLSGKQLFLAYVWILPFAAPGIAIGLSLVALFHYHVVTAQSMIDMVGFSLPSNATIPGAIAGFALTGLPVKLVGLLAAHFYGRRPLRGVFDDLQVWLVELLIGFGKLGKNITDTSNKVAIRLFTPSAFQARYNLLVAHRELGTAQSSGFMKFIFVLMGAGYIFLIGFGAYVIFWKARGH